MNYALITSIGRVYMFYVKEAAEIYQRAYGGTLVDNSILLNAENAVKL